MVVTKRAESQYSGAYIHGGANDHTCNLPCGDKCSEKTKAGLGGW